MKKLLFFVFAVLALSNQSCSNDLVDSSDLGVSVNRISNSDIEVDTSDPMLHFDSMESFQDTLAYLENLSKDEVLKWNDYKGFVSMFGLYTQVDMLIDDVKNTEEYYQIRNEYSSIFIFNTDDYYDLSMYLPVDDILYSKVINKDGKVEIGDSVYCFKDFKTFEDFKKAKGYIFSETMTMAASDENYCELTDNYEKRKFHVQSSWDPARNSVAFGLWAYSKFLFGWKGLSTEYYCWDSKTTDIPVWHSPEMGCGTTYWSNRVARRGNYYICTRSFTSDRRVLIKINV